MYSKLKEGRYIKFPNNLPDPEKNGSIMIVPTNNFYINQSHREGGKTFGAKQSTMVEMPAGHGAKAHRNFVWLPYVVGAVTMVPLDQADVLTGQMSGCWLIICKLRAPPYTRYACHVGTKEGGADLAVNVAVKKAWKDYFDSGVIEIIGGFNPARSLATIPKRKDDEAGKGFGLWAVMTAANEFYNIFCYQQKDDFWRIAHSGKVVTTLPANLVTLA